MSPTSQTHTKLENKNRDLRRHRAQELGGFIWAIATKMSSPHRRRRMGGDEPHMPPPAACGWPREVTLREVVNSDLWRMLPSDFPSFTTVQRYFYAWRAEGRWQCIIAKSKRIAVGQRRQLSGSSCITPCRLTVTRIR